MRRQVVVELLKIRTTRLAYGLLGTAAGLTIFDAVLRSARAGDARIAPLNTATGLHTIVTLTGFALLMAIVFGVTVSSGEFRHETATATYLGTPDRVRVLIAKAIAAAGVGLVFGLLGAAIATGVGLAFVAAHGYTAAISAGTILGYAAGSTLAAGLLAGAGVGIGSLIRDQLGAVILVFAWGFVFEAVIGGLFNTIGPYLPFTAATTMAGAKLGGGGFGFAGSSSASPLPFVAAVILVGGLAALLSAIAARTTVAKDIS